MGFRPFATRTLALSRALAVTTALLLGTPRLAPAADATAPTPAPSKHVRAHAASKESAAARREREHRQDLERRIEVLEQRSELKDPVMPPPDAPTRDSKP